MVGSHVDPANVAARFRLPASIQSVERVGAGHINDSYRARTSDGGMYLLQKINTGIFREPLLLMENVEKVIAHLASKCEVDRERRVLTLIPTDEGGFCFEDNSTYWRMYVFIDRTYIHRAVDGPQEARTAGEAFGQFQAKLADIPQAELHETMPGFHDTPARYSLFEQAVELDPVSRARECEGEIRFARHRAELSSLLVDAESTLPTRIAHNDAKISNVLLDETTHEALCVVDLDTVMPGLSLYDFGDMTRSMTSGLEEDEQDVSSVQMQPELFRALTEGYLSETSDLLTIDERRLMVSAGMVITFEQGLRFLTDYLNGDAYYRVSYPGHNLQRARAQFALLSSMEERRRDMERIVRAV